MPQLNQKLKVETPLYDVITVTKNSKEGEGETPPFTKQVALLGLLTDEKDVYRPGAFAGATIEPVIATTQRLLSSEKTIAFADLVIPLTHQGMEQDIAFGQALGGNVFPIILGGHDHSVYFDYPVEQKREEKEKGCSRLFKVGVDAENAGIIDICWSQS